MTMFLFISSLFKSLVRISFFGVSDYLLWHARGGKILLFIKAKGINAVWMTDNNDFIVLSLWKISRNIKILLINHIQVIFKAYMTATKLCGAH
jgi:hypothetical protein